jgi:hypothetical protein
LHTQQANDGGEAVLDSVAHLSRQQGLVIEGFLKLGIGVLAFDGDSEQTCKAR